MREYKLQICLKLSKINVNLFQYHYVYDQTQGTGAVFS
jgi:hypothetical protein